MTALTSLAPTEKTWFQALVRWDKKACEKLQASGEVPHVDAIDAWASGYANQVLRSVIEAFGRPVGSESTPPNPDDAAARSRAGVALAELQTEGAEMLSLVLPSQGLNPGLVAHYTSQFGRRWQAMRSTLAATLEAPTLGPEQAFQKGPDFKEALDAVVSITPPQSMVALLTAATARPEDLLAQALAKRHGVEPTSEVGNDDAPSRRIHRPS